jgi:uncharacterized membrane protein
MNVNKTMLINRRRKIIKIIWIFVGILGIIGMVGFTLIPLFQAL